MEWAEHPYECDLHRVSNINVYLKNKLKISELKLKSPCNFEEKIGIIYFYFKKKKKLICAVI
ncbi:MAG TPA: hypothetical protein DC049_01485 [Spirochaetia bacterium]|nr:hypothetical protein [Spirochaetia bacterium]